MQGKRMSGGDLLRHEQVTDLVREKVYAKEWGVDGPIPSENELVGMLGISRGTVHKGIQALVDEGLLVRHQGRGTFAARPLMARPSNTKLVSFAESMDEQDIPYTTTVIERRVEKATGMCAAKLEIPDGCDYLYLTRVRSVRGRPVMFIESHINTEACPGIEDADFESESVFAAVERTSGRAVGRSQMTYSACVAGKARGAWLECDEHTPVLNVDQLVRLEDDTPFEWGSVWLPANRCVLSNEVKRG
ncbi:MAG: GntR family transcriptional regulator [Coriobacteriales bacterium]|nr:GntR family transcriptional regulator [Coriobacteriales bacterium]